MGAAAMVEAPGQVGGRDQRRRRRRQGACWWCWQYRQGRQRLVESKTSQGKERNQRQRQWR